MPRPLITSIAVVLAVLAGCGTVYVRPSTAAEPVSLSPAATAQEPIFLPPGPLGELDGLLLESYRLRRASVKEATSPVIVVSGNNLILYRRGIRESVRVIPDRYHALKSVAHLPFAIYLRLTPEARASELPVRVLASLRAFGPKIAAARAALAAAGLTEEQAARQREILEGSDGFIMSVLDRKQFDDSVLEAYIRRMQPLMTANADDAACLQIQATHAQVMLWKQTMAQEEWRRLRVVNHGGHQARYRNAATQYFSWLLRDQGAHWSYAGESMKIIYAESIGKGEDERDLLGTVLVDADASAAFFGDAWRLSEDVLSDGAAACIQQLHVQD